MANAGRLYLWRYLEGTKNFPGWHLTADGNGCEELLGVLDKWGCERTVNVTPPTPAILQVPGNRGGAARWWSPKKFVLAPGPDGDDTLWRVEVSPDRLRLAVGPAKAQELHE